MQQVIGGTLGGRRLLSLPKRIQGVRPTSSRVRGAIFDRIQQEVQGAQVLDLFAGTGATSIEALSRGANKATLIERMPEMQNFLRKQLDALDLTARCDLQRGDVRQVLAQGRLPKATYNLVFCDPPYAQTELYEPVLEALSQSGALTSGALVVVERSNRELVGDNAPAGWDLERQRRYGDTELLFWRLPLVHSESANPETSID